MCGRFDNGILRDVYRALFDVERLPDWNFPPRYNVAPTDTIPVVRIDPRDGVRELVLMRWGLVPYFMNSVPKVPHINARAETVERLPLFRAAFAKRRCLIPATGFFEWQKRADGKQPYRFVRDDLQPFAFAGIWEYTRINKDGRSEDLLSAAIIVGEPNPLVAPVHDRMPVILMPEDCDRWLDPKTSIDGAKAMLRPFDHELMRAYEVSRVVNSVKNDTPECIEPTGEPLP
jgi:putative SOS response-associated peptidase YedK